MSDRTFRISRWKLFQSSSVAPFVALMARADGPSPMTPLKGKLPDAAADALLTKAQGHKPQVPPGLFKSVAPGQKDLDVELYAIGYKRTEQQMVETLDRLGGDSKGPAKILAAGCG